jgi:hypothetical protein
MYLLVHIFSSCISRQSSANMFLPRLPPVPCLAPVVPLFRPQATAVAVLLRLRPCPCPGRRCVIAKSTVRYSVLDQLETKELNYNKSCSYIFSAWLWLNELHEHFYLPCTCMSTEGTETDTLNHSYGVASPLPLQGDVRIRHVTVVVPPTHPTLLHD